MEKELERKLRVAAENIAADLVEDAAHLLKSGMIDPEAYDPDGYALIRVLLSAAMERRLMSLRPVGINHRADVKNLMGA
jgi:hypothetical protein